MEERQDLISRRAAIDEWRNDFKEYVNALNIPRDDYNGIIAYIDELPSAQPEPCEDAVSRADVEIEIANLLKGVFVEYEDIAKKITARLPSVTPQRKTGKWIKRDVSRQIHGISCSAPNYQCSVCKKWWFHNGGGLKWYKFCPECGADMRGEQNEQTN